MQRRTLLRRFGAASATAIGGVGVAAADAPTEMRWQFEDGHVEELTTEEFRRRSDTPSFEELGGHPFAALECCCCRGAVDCVHCFVCRCDGDDPFEVE